MVLIPADAYLKYTSLDIGTTLDKQNSRTVAHLLHAPSTAAAPSKIGRVNEDTVRTW